MCGNYFLLPRSIIIMSWLKIWAWESGRPEFESISCVTLSSPFKSLASVSSPVK